MKRYSTLLSTGEIQVKTTMRYYLTPVRMASIQKSTNNKCWRGCGENTLLVGMWIGTATIEKSMEVPQKTKIKQPYDPVISLLAMYLEKNIIWKDTCTPVFIAALFTTTKTQKQPKCASTDEWIKMWRNIYIHTHWSISEP